MSDAVYCYICKGDGKEQPIADLHWNGLGIHPRCLVSMEAQLSEARALLKAVKSDLLDRARVDDVAGTKVVNLSSTLWLRLSDVC